MASLNTSKIKLPTSVTAAIIMGAKDNSTIAALSPATPQTFVNTEHILFHPSAEAEVVAEGGQKAAYDQTISSVPAKLVKVQTTTRVTNELQWADEDNRLEIMKAIQEDQAAAIARSLDYVVYHAVNPKTGGALSGGYTALTTGATSVTTAGDALKDFDALVDALNEEHELNGIALSKAFANQMRKLRVPGTGARVFPEVPLNLAVSNIEGVAAATSSTVNGQKATSPTKVLAIAGDFSMIRWGMVRDIMAELIEFGDPDGAGDLKRTNEVAYRTEAVYAYGVLDPKAFAVLKSK